MATQVPLPVGIVGDEDKIPCSVKGCSSQYLAKGLCSLHYQRMAKNSTTNINDSLKSRILDNVETIPETSCWWWRGNIGSHGYGKICYKRKHMMAHRASYQAHKGEIPSGLVVMHSCDNKSCVNPDHLTAGTQKQNIEDMVKKGRQAKGERQGATALKDSDVIDIRLKASTMTHKEISKIYSVSRSTIGKIVSGQNWRYL